MNESRLGLTQQGHGCGDVMRGFGSWRVGDGANMLVAVPGGGDDPSGVLVCAENFVIYKNQDPGHPDVCASMFFFLLQTEYGDVFKVTLHHDNEHVTELKIKYFDTIPTASAMCVMKSNGFLSAASEFGNHALYQFQAIGTDPDVESSSSTSMETDEGFQPVLFKPRGLKNLVRIDQMESLMPIMGMKVVNLFEASPPPKSVKICVKKGRETPQIFTLCGRGPRSSLRILRPGLAIIELSVSQLPGVPTAFWTVKKNINDEFDAYIVVSFANATLVLSIGGETVEEVSDSGEDRRIDEWRTPGKQTIVKLWHQVLISLWPNWEAGASSSSQMEVDEDSVA
ncbi:spliceosome-associated protein 130 A [Tanacetum coccineum]|uniref:Spliceosome-associated protein 130 A n=1 Tax=Tanacetum coccineum TaxID=301880 RepID=A0ABQ5CG58_9ASTR